MLGDIKLQLANQRIAKWLMLRNAPIKWTVQEYIFTRTAGMQKIFSICSQNKASLRMNINCLLWDETIHPCYKLKAGLANSMLKLISIGFKRYNVIEDWFIETKTSN